MELTITETEDVLSYWFDGEIKSNYNNKWFPSGSKGIQSKTDAFIHNKFALLFDKVINGECNLCQIDFRRNLAMIIILDQFSRHIFRYLNEPQESDKRSSADQMGLTVCEYVLSKFLKDFSSDEINVQHLVFVLMPLRHSPNLDRLNYVLSIIDKKKTEILEQSNLIEKFRKQTFRRLQHLQDRAKSEASSEILEKYAFQANEEEIMRNPLVLATDKFLRKYFKSNSSRSLFISLSGGVDSMVLAKILLLLKYRNLVENKINDYKIDKIVGIHIDYSNRPESHDEADFVEDWCINTCLKGSSNISEGIMFRKRVIDEVTRGVTERNDYEKVSRDIRYSYYSDILNEFSADLNETGIFFGHHIGDVQENVISNVMRGLSPLALSGMKESSLANGVLIWRPLISNSKTEIYEFAHRWGIPYLKDTTPSWSTRGKLRNQLIPLLLDIYGEGCLKNISSLAGASDEAQQLVQNNIYKPFIDSVRRFPCGLVVNILPFIHQPASFWREMLKELMHSMSMSMVREAAVNYFLERIAKFSAIDDKTSVSKISGWLELRKGFFTYLCENGDFITYRNGCLLNGEKELTTYEKKEVKVNILDTMSFLSSIQKSQEMTCLFPTDITICLNNWKIAISVLEIEESNHLKISELCPMDILAGQFSYFVDVSIESTFICHLIRDCNFKATFDISPLCINKGGLEIINTELYSCISSIPFALKKIDKRFKESIPFLGIFKIDDPPQKSNSSFKRLLFTYEYSS